MSYDIRILPQAQADIERHRKAGDASAIRKIQRLLGELADDPRGGTGRPKQLKGDLSGYYSRRITQKHRLVYAIEDEIVTVVVVSAYDHYGDR